MSEERENIFNIFVLTPLHVSFPIHTTHTEASRVGSLSDGLLSVPLSPVEVAALAETRRVATTALAHALAEWKVQQYGGCCVVGMV